MRVVDKNLDAIPTTWRDNFLKLVDRRPKLVYISIQYKTKITE